MILPEPRGAVSAALLDAWRRPPHELPEDLAKTLAAVDRDAVTDDDLQLTLFLCYELHYRGWAGVSDRWEWDPSLLALRAAAEGAFERALRDLVGPPPEPPEPTPGAVARALSALVAADDGPSLSRYVERAATAAQLREFLTHRAVYHLREADPHTWAIPRLDGAAKAALVEIQMDEYGGGRPERMHAELFRTTMLELGMDPQAGHVDAVPAVTLATNNVMSLFGLHRRHRGAAIGHLAAFELTSTLPNRRYGNGLRRLGGGPRATRYFDEHVEADAVHEQIAAHDLCGRFCQDHPEQVPNVLFGAAAALAVDRLFAVHVLGAWTGGRSSLRAPAG